MGATVWGKTSPGMLEGKELSLGVVENAAGMWNTLFFTGGSGDSTSKLIQVVDWVIFCGCGTEVVISLLVVSQSTVCSYRLPHSFLRVP